MQYATDIHIDHPVPLVHLQRIELGKRHDPGVVDQHIDPAELLQGEVDEGLGVFPAGHIQAPACGAAAGLADFRHQALQAFATPCAEQ
ncbi:hypothetical protein D3C84_1167150 [compost metagenome]